MSIDSGGASEDAAMTELDWLKAKDPDAMLELIQSRFSPRRWHYLACAHVRRLNEFLPDGPLRQILEWAELNAGSAHQDPDSQKFRDQIEPASREAAEEAAVEQRLIVLAADPDSDPDQFQTNESRRSNPSALLFQAACQAAVYSIEEARTTMEHVGTAILSLISLRPGLEMLTEVRRAVVQATRIRANASIYAHSALKLKSQGDEFADQNTSRKMNIQFAKAQNLVTEEQEQVANKLGDQQELKEKADRKALGKFLLELVGNPFKPYRFEPVWRTDHVSGLARGIHEDRAFDRMAILADALLDADCDEEAILRHCRGTEIHSEGALHIRGCWVIDEILDLEPAFFAHPLITTKSVAAPPARGAVADQPNWARLLEALQGDDLVDPDEE
jgi:hypothetical protein